MDVLDATVRNLTTPAVIAFALGIVGTLIKSDLRLPDQIAKAITIYLLLAIGIKGGVSLAVTPMSEFAIPAAGTLAIGVTTPLIAYAAWRRIARFGITDSAAMAAHYGSVSLATFAESLNFLSVLGITPEGYMPALLTLLEIPAIVVALAIAKLKDPGENGGKGLGDVLRHVLPEQSVVLLVGGLVIGWLGGTAGYDQVKGLLDDPFRGILMLFLLQMGVVAAGHLKDLRTAGPWLIVLAIALPVVNGFLGALVGTWVGLSVGGATVLASMAASASYIAAPAAVSMALPKANPAYYLTAAIGITFPFNVALGIPIYYAMADALAA